jgi:hypothetical protein
MAESWRSKAKRYADGQFNKAELLALSGLLLADKVIDLATYGRLNKLTATALKRVVIPAVSTSGRLAGQAALGVGRLAMTPAASIAASTARAAVPLVTNPYLAGTALGLGALQTQPGQQLLEMAEERGRMDRIRFEQALTDLGVGVTKAKKRTKSKFNKMVSKGMSTLKSSTSYGKKGIINAPKKAFKAVVAAASAVNRVKKLPKSGMKRKLMIMMRKI